MEPDSTGAPADGARWAAAAVAAALVVHAALAWHFRAAALTAGQDDAIYLLLAKALRAGSYRDLWLVEAPVESRYPPGYPAFLAVFAGTGPGMFARGVALNIALSMLGLALAYLVARRWSAPLAALTVVVLAVNPSLVHYAGEVRSEPLFLVLSLLVLVLLARPAPGRGRMVLAGALAILGALTRSIGLVLLPVVLVPWLRARAWRAAGAYALVALLTVGGWLLWTVRAPVKLAGESYVADALLSHPPAPRRDTGGLGAGGAARAPARRDDAPGAGAEPAGPAARARSLPARIGARVRHHVPAFIVRRIPTLLAWPAVPGTRLDNLVAALLVTVAGAVGLALVATRSAPALVYLAGYAGVLLVWPYALGRFLVPVLPFLVLMLLLGLAQVPRLWRGGERWRAALPLVALLLVSSAATLRARNATLAGCDRAAPYASAGCFSERQRAFFALTGVVAATLPADAILLTPKAATLTLLTGRRTVHELYAASLTPDALLPHLDRLGVSHILLSRVHADQRAIARDLLPACDEFRVLATAGDEALLLARQPAGAEAQACGRLSAFLAGQW